MSVSKGTNSNENTLFRCRLIKSMYWMLYSMNLYEKTGNLICILHIFWSTGTIHPNDQLDYLRGIGPPLRKYSCECIKEEK